MTKKDIERIMEHVEALRGFAYEAGKLQEKANLQEVRAAQRMDTIEKILRENEDKKGGNNAGA